MRLNMDREKTRKEAKADAADARLFWEWLIQQTGRADPIGDFARAAERADGGVCCRLALYSRAAVRAHLVDRHGACDATVKAGEAAWDEFHRDLIDRVIEAAEHVRAMLRRHH